MLLYDDQWLQNVGNGTNDIWGQIECNVCCEFVGCDFISPKKIIALVTCCVAVSIYPTNSIESVTWVVTAAGA